MRTDLLDAIQYNCATADIKENRYAAGQQEHLPLRDAPGGERVELDLTWHITPATELISLQQACERDLRDSVEGPLCVVGVVLQVLEQVRLEPVGCLVVGGEYGHETPALLTAILAWALVICGLLDQLTVDLVH